jgi:hypothetical protein
MGKDTVERQADYKARMYAKGFKQKQTWMDEDGFTVGPKNIKDRERPRVSHAKFLRELRDLTNPMGEAMQEKVYAELLVHARALRMRWDSKANSR